MKIISYETAKKEGAQEVLKKMETTIKTATPDVVKLLQPFLDIIEAYKKQYK